MRRVLSLSAAILLLWVGLALAATKVVCIVDTDATQNPDYTSLAAAIAGETGASPKCVTSADLVTNDEQLTIECRASSGAAEVLSSQITIDGFILDADCYVDIFSPVGHRSNGVWDDDKYVLDSYTNEVSRAIEVKIPFVRIRHLQVHKSPWGSTRGVMFSTGANNGLADGVIVKGKSMSGAGYGFDSYYCKDTIFRNCISIGSGIGIRFIAYDGDPLYAINCTVYDAYDYGIYSDANYSAYAINCAVFNTSVDDFGGAGLAISYCASDDGDGTNAVALNDNASGEWASAFTDYANGDFSLKSGSPLIDAGIGPALDSNVPTTDIVGTSRSGNTCDIGAFEFVDAGGTGSKWNGITPAKWNGVDWSNLKWNGM